MAMKDLTGIRFGNLTVLSWSHRVFISSRYGYRHYWLCQCDCGNKSTVMASGLRAGTRSCGCKSSRLSVGELFKTHGMTRHPTYSSWRGMKDRCYCKSHSEYKRYGAVGVKVCERWRDDFLAFYNDMGPRPEGYSLDRIDPRGDYEPDNCRWADSSTQATNKKNWNPSFVNVFGVSLTLLAACKLFNLSTSVILRRSRLSSMSVQEAFDKSIAQLSQVEK